MPNSQRDPRERPMPGTVSRREIRIPVCRECGYAIDGGLCSDTCINDGNPHKNPIIAVYWRIDVFIRDTTIDDRPEGDQNAE